MGLPGNSGKKWPQYHSDVSGDEEPEGTLVHPLPCKHSLFEALESFWWGGLANGRGREPKSKHIRQQAHRQNSHHFRQKSWQKLILLRPASAVAGENIIWGCGGWCRVGCRIGWCGAAPPFHRATAGLACGGVAECGTAAVGHGGGAGAVEPCFRGLSPVSSSFLPPRTSINFREAGGAEHVWIRGEEPGQQDL